MIPISEELRSALIEYRKTVPHAGPKPSPDHSEVHR
jgi:hypothetical protein